MRVVFEEKFEAPDPMAGETVSSYIARSISAFGHFVNNTRMRLEREDA